MALLCKVFRPKTVFLSALLVLASALRAEPLPSSSSYALEGMAPANRWAVRLEVRSNGYDKRYNNQGKREDLDAVFDGVELNGSVFSALALLGPAATFGTTAMDTRVDLERTELTLAYGITENITIGMLLPYTRTHTSVRFSVQGGNVGFNPLFNPGQPMGPANFPFAPVGGGAAAPIGTAGVKQLITDPAFGYAYADIGDTRVSGLDDPTLGVLWRMYKGAADSLVLAAGVRFGVADGDDPDNLLDAPTGDGSTDIRSRLEYFRDLGAGFDARVLIESKIQTSDTLSKRVPVSGQLLATANSKEKLERDLGDIRECDLELGHRWSDWRAAATWHRYEKSGDDYGSDRGTDVSSVEANTAAYANQWRASVSWSGINAWRAGNFALPLILKLEMQETYAARNFPDVRDVYLNATTFF